MQVGQQFFTLMPDGSPLAVQGIFEGSEGGFVHLGDPVTIKFDTFQYSHYGMAYGTVQQPQCRHVLRQRPDRGAASAVPLPGPSMVSGSTVDAFYIGQVSIDRVALRDVPANFHVTPGMTVIADIKVGKRTVLDILHEPDHSHCDGVAARAGQLRLVLASTTVEQESSGTWRYLTN